MNEINFIGDGNITEFDFSFPFFTKKDVVVLVNSVPATEYSISVISNGQDADIPYSGGKVIFNTAPRNADVISIYRQIELERIIDYQPTAQIDPIALNNDMNFVVEALKDAQNKLSKFADRYSEITSLESTGVLLDKIETVNTEIKNVLDQIDSLGDIQSIHSSIQTLNNSVSELNTTLVNLTNFKNDVLDYVIESQIPNAENNYTWYRKYKSGWVEQGGSATINAQNANTQLYTDVNLPITMANQAYLVNIAFITDGGSTTGLRNNANGRGTTKLTIGTYSTTEISQSYCVTWEVKGSAA